jgi:hypothetical protein
MIAIPARSPTMARPRMGKPGAPVTNLSRHRGEAGIPALPVRLVTESSFTLGRDNMPIIVISLY